MAHQLLRVDDRAALIKRVFLQNHQRLLRMVPRTAGDPNRLVTIAFSTIALDADLVRCTPESLFGGVIETLKLGLTIGGPLQESWLIPFKNTKSNTLEATLIIGYQGYRTLIDRAKAVVDLHPRAVFAGDEFDVELGTHPRISHKPAWMLGREPGEFLAAYAVARLRGGGLQLEVMPKAEIDAHRARSRAADRGPWVTDYVPMALKTVIRKISKYLPKTSWEMARALELDDRADRGVAQEFDLGDVDLSAILDAEQLAPPPKDTRLNRLTETLGGPSAAPRPAPETAKGGQSGDASTPSPEGTADVQSRDGADLGDSGSAGRQRRGASGLPLG
jgi:recombination protein RecT